MLLYHGGERELKPQNIIFPGLRNDCDFGAGFYCAENKETADEWVAKKPFATKIISVYEYTPNANNEIILGEMDWLKVILGFRENMYTINFSKNVVIGEIANDDMRVSIPAFVMGGELAICDKRLLKSLQYVKLGLQYVFKFSTNGLKFVDSYEVTSAKSNELKSQSKIKFQTMSKDLRTLRNSVFPDGKFFEDYLEKAGESYDF
jgi:hypothetical protein